MSTELPIPTGPTNREIIDRAYQIIGISDVMFGRSQEEYAAAMLPLGAMMLEWPYSLIGYIYEDTPGGRVGEESGIDRKWMEAVAHGLAERWGSSFGRTLSANAQKVKAQTYSRLCAAVADIPEAIYADGTVTGAGRSWHNRTYFPRG